MSSSPIAQLDALRSNDRRIGGKRLGRAWAKLRSAARHRQVAENGAWSRSACRLHALVRRQWARGRKLPFVLENIDELAERVMA